MSWIARSDLELGKKTRNAILMTKFEREVPNERKINSLIRGLFPTEVAEEPEIIMQSSDQSGIAAAKFQFRDDRDIFKPFSEIKMHMDTSVYANAEVKALCKDLRRYCYGIESSKDQNRSEVLDFSDSEDIFDHAAQDNELINLELQLPDQKKNMSGAYVMSHGKRGRCLIINNYMFKKSSPRLGSEVDVTNLRTVFKELGFHVILKINISSHDFEKVIADELQNPDHMKWGMFVLIIMSHGSEGSIIYGTDDVGVYLHTLQKRVYNCKELEGKPKFIVIQACAGRDIPICEYDGASVKTTGLSEDVLSCDKSVSAQPEDVLILKSAFEGFVSLRYPKLGTPFMRALVEALYKHAHHHDVVAICEQVQNKIRIFNKRGNEQAPLPSINSFLTKKLHLFQGIVSDACGATRGNTDSKVTSIKHHHSSQKCFESRVGHSFFQKVVFESVGVMMWIIDASNFEDRALDEKCKELSKNYCVDYKRNGPRLELKGLHNQLKLAWEELEKLRRKGNSNSDKAEKMIPRFNEPVILHVRVYSDDITNIKCQAIVNAANKKLYQTEGVALAILRASGEDFQKKCLEELKKIKKTGVLNTGEVIPVRASGRLLKDNGVDYIINAVCPRFHDSYNAGSQFYQNKTYIDEKERCLKLLSDAIYNSLNMAEELRCESIAIPALGSGIFGVPMDIRTQAYVEGLERFAKRENRWHVKEVAIVNINKDTTRATQKAFNSLPSRFFRFIRVNY